MDDVLKAQRREVLGADAVVVEGLQGSRGCGRRGGPRVGAAVERRRKRKQQPMRKTASSDEIRSAGVGGPPGRARACHTRRVLYLAKRGSRDAQAAREVCGMEVSGEVHAGAVGSLVHQASEGHAGIVGSLVQAS